MAAIDQPQQLGRSETQTTGERDSWFARNRVTVEAWLFILPFLVIYVVLQVYPVLQAALMSVFDWDLLDPSLRQFVGLDNYGEMFGGSGLTWDLTHLAVWRVIGLLALVGTAVAAARGALNRRAAITLGALLVLVFGVLLGIHPGPDGAWNDALFWGPSDQSGRKLYAPRARRAGCADAPARRGSFAARC